MPQRVSLGAMLTRPAPGARVPLPAEPPNRPIGQDWIGDATDALLGGLGLNNTLDPEASKATLLGGLLSAAIPLGMMGKLGKAAQDIKAGLSLPRSKAALSETRMGEFLAAHGGTAAPMSAADAQTLEMFQAGGKTRPSLAEWTKKHGGADPGLPQVAPEMATRYPLGQGALPEGGTMVPKGIKAYHGSPHDFEQFSLGKIGTGEGAQAYGHGLYFAENEGVAKGYKDALSDFMMRLDNGVDVRPARGSIEDRALAYLEDAHVGQSSAPFHHARKAIQNQIPSMAANGGDPNVLQKMLSVLDEWEARGGKPVKSGKTYEVNIKADPEYFLDWDKPLSQQPESVRKALGSLGVNTGPYEGFKVAPSASGKSFKVMQGGYEYGTYRSADATAARVQELSRSHTDTGESLYRTLDSAPKSFNIKPDMSNFDEAVSQIKAGRSAASQKLHEAGIPGIKYLDQGSRAAGEGSRNYVVFDDKTIEILRKYGIALPLSAGVAASARK